MTTLIATPRIVITVLAKILSTQMEPDDRRGMLLQVMRYISENRFISAHRAK